MSNAPPTMPIVSAFDRALLSSVKPMAAPAALTIAVSSTPRPIATIQPKNAAPQLIPPNSSRCRRRASRSTTTASSATARSRRVVVAVALPSPLVAGGGGGGSVVVATAPPLSASAGAPSRSKRFDRSNIVLLLKGFDVLSGAAATSCQLLHEPFPFGTPCGSRRANGANAAG